MRDLRHVLHHVAARRHQLLEVGGGRRRDLPLVGDHGIAQGAGVELDVLVSQQAECLDARLGGLGRLGARRLGSAQPLAVAAVDLEPDGDLPLLGALRQDHLVDAADVDAVERHRAAVGEAVGVGQADEVAGLAHEQVAAVADDQQPGGEHREGAEDQQADFQLTAACHCRVSPPTPARPGNRRAPGRWSCPRRPSRRRSGSRPPTGRRCGRRRAGPGRDRG